MLLFRRSILTILFRLLQSGNYADAIVMTGDLQWKVHRTTLVARSVWFSDAFKKEQGVVMPEINLSPRPDHKVSLLLQCLYAHRLPDEFYDLASAEATFEKYVELFKLGDEFGVEFVRDDALTMLGRLCDQKLVAICSFNKEWSGREGVVNPRAGASVDFVDLGVALHDAFEGGIRTDLRAQSLLANFVYAGRAVLLEHPHLLNLVDSIDSIAAGLWRASNGQNLAGWLPNVKVKTFLGFDHTKKTQHPDRCELCDELFDDANRKRVMYDPHKVITRPAGYCGVCVEKHDGDAAPIFRRPGRTDLNYVDQMPVVKTEEDA
ncbi:hypothetical protein QBC35DRAFT_393482 [Podospora australis]|uniref:BTB domain-containing protein n=1 Tax=Podospora australis TaxID=1536484 RepID=A0AAN7AEH6_9PEZI|nr:hypothetical protein QBC35DRAFT_393482 [Podospora australis]